MAKGLHGDARAQAAARAWQRMLSGRRLDLLDPSPLDIEIEDIAHGLARVARWNGQTIGEHGFSVAQHSLVVEEIAAHIAAGAGAALAPGRPAARRAGICDRRHDLAVQGGAGLNYRGFEERLEAAIHLRFGLPARPPPPIKTLIKRADRASAFFEATQLAGFTSAEALGFFGAPPKGYHLELRRCPPPRPRRATWTASICCPRRRGSHPRSNASTAESR